MAGVLLPVCSVFFSLLLFIVYFTKKRIKILENNMYSVMVVGTVIDSIFVSILQGIVQFEISSFSEFIIYLINKFDFALLVLICNALLFYTMLITIPKFKELFKKLIIPFLVVDGITIILIFIKEADV